MIAAAMPAIVASLDVNAVLITVAIAPVPSRPIAVVAALDDDGLLGVRCGKDRSAQAKNSQCRRGYPKTTHDIFSFLFLGNRPCIEIPVRQTGSQVKLKVSNTVEIAGF
jgi:hypothetical protein